MATLTDLQKDYSDKKILIFGLGIQGGGIETAAFFAKMGLEVCVTDMKSEEDLQSALKELGQYTNIRYTLGEHNEDDIRWADVIIQNPGVKSTHPLLKRAEELKKEITMEIALFMKYNPSTTVGVTGTRGKSTTTFMIYEVLKKLSGKNVHLAGNVPKKAAIGLLGKVGPDDITVLELSSYQLHSFENYRVSPHIAVFTNFYPDHLNYYASMDDYLEDKINVFRYQKKSDILVSSKEVMSLPRVKKAFGSTFVESKPLDFASPFTYLSGEHNRMNAAYALHVAQAFHIDGKAAEHEIAGFKGLPFRQEYLGTISGIPFYNDSTSTTPIACVTALKTMKEKYPGKPLTLILGGNSKNLPLEALVDAVNSHATEVYLLKGSLTDEIKDKLRHGIVRGNVFDSIPVLFESLIPALKPHHTVLFSPAATSFATFRNEFDRGEKFTATFLAAQKKYGA